MKKFLVFLLVAVMTLSMAGCGDGDASGGADQTGGDSGSGQAAGKFETEDVRLLDREYDEDDTETLALMDEIQGKVTFLDNGGTFPVFIAGDKVYVEEYGVIKAAVELPEAPEDAIYFDNLSIGENVFVFKDGEIALYPLDGLGLSFEGVAFDAENDFMGEIPLSSYFNVLRLENGVYVDDYYQRDDETQQFVLNSQNAVNAFYNSNGEELTVKEIIPLRSNMDGYCVYVLTENQEVYWVDGINRGKMTMTSATPLVTNAAAVYAPADAGANLTLPVYSKVDDETALYSAAPGADILDASDNFEIAFILPDGCKPADVNDVFRVSDRLVFAFENGDVYYTDEIEDEGVTSYELTKLEDVSRLNAGGDVLDMAGASVLDDNLYLLMSDGCIYCRELD